MSVAPTSVAVSGSTMRWTWKAGPTAGKTHEHVFHEDGTVECHEVGPVSDERRPPASGAASPPARVPYAALEVTPDVRLVSYLSPAGFTLTVALDFTRHRLMGFASSATQWHAVRGTFEFVRSSP